MASDLPLLMVSFSDGDDPHFRKATFDPSQCPADCARPCEAICPAAAITFNSISFGVIEDRCYGCGRCLPVCPMQHIETVARATSVESLAPSLLEQVDAIEIHTQVGRLENFRSLWAALSPHIHQLSVISISCSDQEGAIAYLWDLYDAMQPLTVPLIWQADGRSMSGDIGKGTTHATLRFARELMGAGPPGYVQLAGGTNAHTLSKLDGLVGSQRAGSPLSALVPPMTPPAPQFGGIGFGSFARSLLSSLMEDDSLWQPLFASTPDLSKRFMTYELSQEDRALSHLITAVNRARSLVAPLKRNRPAIAPSRSETCRDRPKVSATSRELPLYSSSFE